MPGDFLYRLLYCLLPVPLYIKRPNDFRLPFSACRYATAAYFSRRAGPPPSAPCAFCLLSKRTFVLGRQAAFTAGAALQRRRTAKKRLSVCLHFFLSRQQAQAPALQAWFCPDIPSHYASGRAHSPPHLFLPTCRLTALCRLPPIRAPPTGR